MSMLDRLLLRVNRSLAVRLRQLAGNAARRALELEFASQGLAGAPAIRTYTTRAELEALYHLAAALPARANIVELGSYLGASTCFLAAGASPQQGTVTAIDRWRNETMPDGPRDTFEEFQRNIAGVADRVRIVRKHTHEITTADLQPPVHLGFIDADHSYEATRADAALLAPHIAPDGLLAFHDATTFEGVGRAVAELLATAQWVLAGKVDSLLWLRRAAWARWPIVPSSPAP